MQIAVRIHMPAAVVDVEPKFTLKYTTALLQCVGIIPHILRAESLRVHPVRRHMTVDVIGIKVNRGDILVILHPELLKAVAHGAENCIR
ncbi:hypothetical protein D3C75_1212420 [compost metagenome]